MKARGEKAFTLVEVLVVLALTGILMGVIYQLYLNLQKSALGQEEVVELQQNLRVAMDHLTADLRQAGFLVFRHHPPLQSAPHLPSDSAPLILNSACPSGFSAPLGAGTVVRGSTSHSFRLAAPDLVEQYQAGDPVRLIRAVEQRQPLDRLLYVADRDVSAASLTLEGFVATDDIDYRAGDVLVRGNAVYPGSISYFLKDHELFVRHSGVPAQRVTAKKTVGGALVNGLTAFALEYLLEDGSWRQAPTAAELEQIRAVRVVLEGRARTPSGDKTRALQSVIALRNR
ncbi:MAG: prepilin-type N-terminal cleavage/methylation domain-containing protein [Trichloromonas sp.]|jgi:prepilin-type N-terminal cleavage/methylation domain-containing protein|nr:prepilin-type N-terminal cleavage/methylation domain-containing protein [Trichloromonas sp.]